LRRPEKKERLEKLERERQEKLERERQEKARLAEGERIRAKAAEEARIQLEKERLAREALAKAMEEKERLLLEAQEKIRQQQEKERIEKELAAEKQRLEQERLEKERLEKEHIERERAEMERLEKLRLDQEEKERIAKEEQARKPNIIEMSTMLGEKLENEIAEKQTNAENELKAQANAEFVAKLQHIIGAQARNGAVPGVVPAPLPKQIDALLAEPQKPQEKPVVEDEKSQMDFSKTDRAAPEDHKENVLVDKDAKCQVSLKVTPEVVDCGNKITVAFEVLAGKSTPSDWIAIIPAGQSHRNYLTYEWRGKEELKGSVQFTAPAVYGSYEFCYFYNKTYECVGKSNPILVGPQFTVVATTDEATRTIHVKWNQVSGNTYTKPWIGMYEKRQTNNKQYLTWEYANKIELSFPLPIKPNEYEFRFFTNSYCTTARSNTITVTGEDKLSAAIENKILVVRPQLVCVDPATDHAWIGIYPVTQADNHQWTRYKNVPHPTNEITFKTPLKPGEYEVRLFANKTYDVAKTSNKFTVPAQ